MERYQEEKDKEMPGQIYTQDILDTKARYLYKLRCIK